MVDDDAIYTGDLVELEVDSRIWGMAIGFAGSLIYVRHMGGAIGQYHEFELRKMAGSEPDRGGGVEEDVTDNVIPVDFTKRSKIDKNTKTKGAA